MSKATMKLNNVTVKYAKKEEIKECRLKRE